MMETKKFIQEKLTEEFCPHKRMSMVKAIMNKCTNHLFDAYRDLDTAIQYCDNPVVREKLEAVRRLLGKDNELAGYSVSETPSVITDLQAISSDIDP
jgi:hypothetical protein